MLWKKRVSSKSKQCLEVLSFNSISSFYGSTMKQETQIPSSLWQMTLSSLRSLLSSSLSPPLVLTIKALSAEMHLFHTEMKQQQIREEDERGVINQENMLSLTRSKQQQCMPEDLPSLALAHTASFSCNWLGSLGANSERQDVYYC